jgi:predicted NAD/FAD-binding protein
VSRKQIAVVGSGVAGLTAAYVLQRGADVSLYEADPRLGGHADTHDVAASDGRVLGIDTGFIVHNRVTYPTLLRLFAELGVATQESDMSMSISCAGCGLEYAGGRGVSGLLPSARTVARPKYLRMLTEVKRFHRRARALLDSGDEQQTLREFLAEGGFTDYFVAHFMTPLIAAVWSTAPSRTGDYPARYLFVFLANHGMLSVTGSPTWYTVMGGSARYVERAAKGLTAVHTSTPVRSVTRVAGGVEIRDDADAVRRYDGVVLATHPGQALSLLEQPTTAERDVTALSATR